MRKEQLIFLQDKDCLDGQTWDPTSLFTSTGKHRAVHLNESGRLERKCFPETCLKWLFGNSSPRKRKLFIHLEKNLLPQKGQPLSFQTLWAAQREIDKIISPLCQLQDKLFTKESWPALGLSQSVLQREVMKCIQVQFCLLDVHGGQFVPLNPVWYFHDLYPFPYHPCILNEDKHLWMHRDKNNKKHITKHTKKKSMKTPEPAPLILIPRNNIMYCHLS